MNHFTQNRRTAQTATYPNAGEDVAALISIEMKTDVVDLHHGAITLGTVYGDLELTGQEGKLRMEGTPLPDDFTQWTRVDDFVRRDAGELIAGHVTDTVARGLDGVHLYLGQTFQHIRYACHGDPVVLQILACGEVRVALIFFARNRT